MRLLSVAMSTGEGMEANQAQMLRVISPESTCTSVTYALSSPPAEPARLAQPGKIVRNGVCSLMPYRPFRRC